MSWLTQNSGNPPVWGESWYGDHWWMDQLVVTATIPLKAGGIKLRFYDFGESFKGEISDEIGGNVIGQVRFEWRENGCGAFDFTLLGRKEDIEADYSMSFALYDRVDIHLFGDAEPWFSGLIDRMPYGAATSAPLSFSGYGFFGQLDTVTVNRSVNSTTLPTQADREVAAVAALVCREDIEPTTRIVYDVLKYTATSPEFYITSLSWSRVTARKVVEDLAQIAQDYVFGVDEYRKLYFKPRSASVNTAAIRWVGKDADGFQLELDGRQIWNKVHVFGGAVTDASNYLVTCEDAASQASYGVREARITLPSALNADDAERWGNDYIEQHKDPLQPASVKGVLLRQALIKAEGKMRVIDRTGTTYELPIKKVAYTINSRGAKVDVQLDKAENPVGDSIADLQRRIALAEIMQEQNVAQLA